MSNVSLRPARRSDTSALVDNANAGFAQSALHRRIALHQDQYPSDYRQWRLNIIRQRFATPNLRTIVAVNADTGDVLGQAAWAVEGADTALHRRWCGERSWWEWVEGKLIDAEKSYTRYVTDRSIDYRFLSSFIAAFTGDKKPKRPQCLHLHMISVDPSKQAKGVGRALVNWGKALASEEGLPLYLEAVVEAVGFYEKEGFVRLSHDMVIGDGDGEETYRIPAFAWEADLENGRWLERDEDEDSGEKRWKWREDMFSK